MKMTEPKLLSECGPILVIDDTPGEHYQVEIDPGEYLVIRTGVTAGKAMMNFTHPNMAASGKSVMEFKHYRKGGGKFWTVRAGMDFYFVIPRTAIKMLPEKGHSYVPAEINGVKVVFNVSGGGGGCDGGWTDWVHTRTSIRINHKMRDLKKFAEVAVRGTALEPVAVEPLDAQDEIRWNRMAARNTKGLIEKVAKLVAEGKTPVVKFMPGYGCDGVHEGKAVEVERRRKRISEPSLPGFLKSWRIEHTGAVNSLILAIDGKWNKVRAKVRHIDWAATAAANGIAA